jgi:hypothetical protein
MKQGTDALQSNVLKWLNDQGYPLEMVVAHALETEGFTVSQSSYYQDPETDKWREIDITAQMHSHPGAEDIFVQVGFCIECKSSPAKPWILFPVPGAPVLFVPALYALGSELSQTLLYSTMGGELLRDSLEVFRETGMFQSSSTSYGLTQAFTSGADLAYQAAMGAAKACMARFAQIEKVNKSPSIRFPLTTMMFPALVIDSRLFESRLDPSGQVALTEVDHGLLEWTGIMPSNNARFRVNIYTKEAVIRLASDMANAAKRLIAWHISHMTLLKSIAKNAKDK